MLIYFLENVCQVANNLLLLSKNGMPTTQLIELATHLHNCFCSRQPHFSVLSACCHCHGTWQCSHGSKFNKTRMGSMKGSPKWSWQHICWESKAVKTASWHHCQQLTSDLPRGSWGASGVCRAHLRTRYCPSCLSTIYGHNFCGIKN